MTDKKTKPEWLTLNTDGTVTVETREGSFTLAEPNGEQYEQVDRVASRIEHISDFTKGLMLVAKALVTPKIGEQDLKKYKISTLKRLVDGINVFADEDMSFLWEQMSSTKQTSGNVSSSSSVSATEKPLTKSGE